MGEREEGLLGRLWLGVGVSREEVSSARGERGFRFCACGQTGPLHWECEDAHRRDSAGGERGRLTGRRANECVYDQDGGSLRRLRLWLWLSSLSGLGARRRGAQSSRSVGGCGMRDAGVSLGRLCRLMRMISLPEQGHTGKGKSERVQGAEMPVAWPWVLTAAPLPWLSPAKI